MPGPTPVDQPVFPVEFVEQAEIIIKQRTAPLHLWRRAMLVVLLDADPEMSSPEAGRWVGLHENSVRNWRRRWTEGDFSLTDKPGRGRKPRFSPLGTE